MSLSDCLTLKITYLYFIHQGSSDLYKVGCSKHPLQRLSELQTANPEVLSLIASFDCHRCNEKYYHNKYQNYRVLGEWFRFSDSELSEIIRSLTIEYGTPKSFDSSSTSLIDTSSNLPDTDQSTLSNGFSHLLKSTRSLVRLIASS